MARSYSKRLVGCGIDGEALREHSSILRVSIQDEMPERTDQLADCVQPFKINKKVFAIDVE